MMRPKPMVKVTVLGPKTYMKKVIDTLYSLNVLHIDDYTKKDDNAYFDIGNPLDDNNGNAKTMVNIRSLISNLKIEGKCKEVSDVSIPTISKKVEKLNDDVSDIINKKEYYSGVLKGLTDVNESNFDIKVGELKHTDYVYMGYINLTGKEISENLDSLEINYHMVKRPQAGKTFAAIFSEKSLMDFLDENGFVPVCNKFIKEAFNNCNEEFSIDNVTMSKAVEKKISVLETKLEEIKEIYSNFLLSAEMKLKAETDKAEVPLRFATSKSTFVINGWFYEHMRDKVELKLKDITNSNIMVKIEKPKRGDKVPIQLDNNKITSPYEFLLGMYDLPHYSEFDPTFFMFMTFPIFFGLMVGDLGYGLISVLLFSFLKKKFPTAKNLLNILIMGGISSMIFGLMYGEYMGFENFPAWLGQALGIAPTVIREAGTASIVYEIPRIFSRSGQIHDLLAIALIIGIVHIGFGLIVGFINLYKEYGLKTAVFEKGSILMLIPATTWFLITQLGIIKGTYGTFIMSIMPHNTAIFGLFLIGSAIATFNGGIQGIMEIPSLLGNILSYGRLMAISLGSVYVSSIINEFSVKIMASGISGIFAGITLLLVGHALNFALGLLGPFLHSLRLHYVEFFSKFLEGGGKQFSSFGLKEE